MTTLRQSTSRILALAWPVFVGQIAVIAFSTVDTVLIARYATTDLAALSVGMAAYISIFVTVMGVLLSISPVAGQAFGAKRLPEAGHAVHQSLWLALALSVVGIVLLSFPQPFISLSKASPDVADKIRGYLTALSFALPGAALFTVFRGFNTAVSRPKVVMVLQLGGLAFKIPLSIMFIHGWGPLPAMGVTGCGVATAIVMWIQCIFAWWLMRRDPFYKPFELHHAGEWLRAPDRRRIADLLRIGIPMGLGIGLEVMGFAFMSIFIARLGTMAVAGHQVAANLVTVMFMMPLALANAATTLVAQRVGANDWADAKRLGWHGMVIAAVGSAALGLVVYGLREPIARLYSNNSVVIAAAMPLLTWVVVFHFFDAVQTMAAFVLRAWRIATVPMFIYAGSLIGVGLGGGWILVFTDVSQHTPSWMQGASGYWVASTAGLICAGVALTVLLALGLPTQATSVAPEKTVP